MSEVQIDFDVSNYMTPGDIYDLVSRTSVEEWREILMNTLTVRNWRGVELPGFPDDKTQKLFVGVYGRSAIESGFRFTN